MRALFFLYLFTKHTVSDHPFSFHDKHQDFLGISGTWHVKTTPFNKKWVFLKDLGLTLLQEHVQACFI